MSQNVHDRFCGASTFSSSQILTEQGLKLREAFFKYMFIRKYGVCWRIVGYKSWMCPFSNLQSS